ncbi:MAG: Zn-dependent oligopeptidase [Bacteroidetes bacterium]|nr:Zn-dependent oligopeptidase [Bacteroidota bacterium]
MKKLVLIALVAVFAFACKTAPENTGTETGNPIFNEFNQPIDFASLTADHIIEASEQSMFAANAQIAAIVDIPDGEKTFANTMTALDEMYNGVTNTSCIIGLMGVSHPDSLTRTTAQVKDTEISQYFNEVSLNEDLYKAIKAYSETDEARGLTGWKQKFVTDEVAEFERNGFALDADGRAKLQVIMDEISVLGDKFGQNIAAYQDFVIAKEEDMEGLNDDYKQARLQEDGTYKIGLAYPDIRPVFRNATNENLRKELLLKYVNRAPENMEVLRQLIAKRMEMAKLLGHETYSDYKMGDKMADNPTTVREFHKELKEMVTPKGYADIAEMVAYQKENLGIDKDFVDPWSRSYTIDKLLKENYGVDAEKVKEYFPLESVVDGLFNITQTLFGLEYKQMKNPSVWHEDVTGYEVYDGETLIGRFYLDLHPRPNKYNHAACFPVIIGRESSQGWQIPTSTLECNFSAPAEGKPALMTHDEVETFFHEFGHVLHSLVSTAEVGVQSGFYVSQDFVEAPSQIFENWVWNYESLSLFSKHYESGEPLPKDLFDKMEAAKKVMSGRNTLYQIFLGELDMTLYGGGFDPEGDISITEIREVIDKEINLLDPLEGSHMAQAFGHLNGYGSSYYGYLWSKVFAQDMFSRFEEEGILSKEAGMDYRNFILGQGATKDEMEMITEFLGRAPEKDAFTRSLGL